jgi:hypothetical protein
MSLGGIFALFGFSDEDHVDKNFKKDLKDFKETPHFKLKMFTKMILNGMNFKKQVVGFFSKADKNLDVVGVDEAGDFMMYNRAWYWISGCSLRKKAWKEALQDNSTPELLFCLKSSVKYFESIEEYEKCAFLIKIQKLVEKEIFKASLKET